MSKFITIARSLLVAIPLNFVGCGQALEVDSDTVNTICKFTLPGADGAKALGETVHMKVKTPYGAGVELEFMSDLDGILGSDVTNERGVAYITAENLSEGTHTLFSSDDSHDCKATTNFTLGTAPEVAFTAPASLLLSDEGVSIDFGVNVSASVVSVELSSDIDGWFADMVVGSGVATGSSDELSGGMHTVTATARDSFGIPGKSTIEVLIDARPSTPVVSVTPGLAADYEDLDAEIERESVDSEGSEVTYRYDWYLNGELYLADGDEWIPASETLPGEEWTVVVTPNDGRLDGDQASATAVISGFDGWNGASMNAYVADTLVVGTDEDDEAGKAIESSCDLNGDGYDDVVIGVADNSAAGSNAGQVYVTWGGRESQLTRPEPIDTELRHSDVRLLGATAGEAAGAQLACAGDINGDGFDDLIVGAPQYYGAIDGGGRVYVVSGAALTEGEAELEAVSWIIDGGEQGEQAGTSVAGGGDIDGDGTLDIVIGAWSNNVGGALAGAVYVVSGDELIFGGSISLAERGKQFRGTAVGERAGYSVAVVSDINGDGRDELLVGAFTSHLEGAYSGAAYMVFGGTVEAAGAITDLSEADVRFIAEGAADMAGYDVAAVGDVTGDGVGDFTITSIGHASNGAYTGKVDIFSGGDVVTGDFHMTDAFATIVGRDSGDYFGFSVASGDIDNDNISDLIVGAPYSNASGIESGSAYLFMGTELQRGGIIYLDEAEFTVNGNGSGDLLGMSVSIGDVDGDGLGDVLVGAPNLVERKEAQGGVVVFVAPNTGR